MNCHHALIVLIFSLINNYFITEAIAKANCSRVCNYENEFSQPDEFTDEFQEFIALLEEKTFQTYSSTFTCNQTDDTTIEIGANSDFLWSLRFIIYNQRQDKTQKTIDNCMCKSEDCGDEFQKCMKIVRLAMIAELNGFWDREINKELERLKNDKLEKECVVL